MELSKPSQKRLWQQIVMVKLQNQSKCLALAGCAGAEELLQLAQRVSSGDAENLEGVGAAYYFPQLFGEGFTRGQDCFINAALNYGYAIVRGAVARNLAIYGLEPCLGIHHCNQLNQFNLADDIMEVYRPLVDLYVAAQIAKENEALTPQVKHELFNITNYMMIQNKERYRCISAIGRCVASFSRVVQKEQTKLELPSLMPLTPYIYE